MCFWTCSTLYEPFLFFFTCVYSFQVHWIFLPPINEDHRPHRPLSWWDNIKSPAVQMAMCKKIIVEEQPSQFSLKSLELVINPYGLVCEQMWQVELFLSWPWSFAKILVHMAPYASDLNYKCYRKIQISKCLWFEQLRFLILVLISGPYHSCP